MGLKFTCSNCRRTHDTGSDSALTNARGSIMGVPWYLDKRGTMHLAMACLHCGTVHDAYGSPAKMLFSLGGRALSVERVFPIGRLRPALAAVNPPWTVLWTLVDHGFLSQEMIEAEGVTGGPVFLPTNEEALRKEMAIQASILKLAIHTSLIGEPKVNDAVLRSFVSKADEYMAATERTPFMENHLSATDVLVNMLEQGLHRREVFRRAQQMLNMAKKDDS